MSHATVQLVIAASAIDFVALIDSVVGIKAIDECLIGTNVASARLAAFTRSPRPTKGFIARIADQSKCGHFDNIFTVCWKPEIENGWIGRFKFVVVECVRIVVVIR